MSRWYLATVLLALAALWPADRLIALVFLLLAAGCYRVAVEAERKKAAETA